MCMKKIIAGICSLVMLATGSMLNLSASAAPSGKDRNQNQETAETTLPENFAGYMGDLDKDVSVGVTDVIMMQKYLLGVQKLDAEQFWFADMNFDAAVNIYDFILLKRAVLSGEWTPVEYEQETTEESTEETTEETQETSEEVPETTEPEENSDFIEAPIKQVLHNLPSQGTGNVVIFYIDFPDQQYSYSPTAEQLNQIAFGEEDESNPNYPFESMKAFYERSSKGTMHLAGQAFRYTAKNNMSYYAQNKDALAKECYEAFDSEVDFSQFDGDGDGDIDVTLLTVPTIEGGDEWASDWWPCAGASGYSRTVADGMKMGHLITGNAQVISETNYSNFTSSYQHEMGHCMGLPDYYLYNSDDGEGFHGITNTAGVELMDMDASTDFGCFSKLMLGWYRQNQILSYDTEKGGAQTFTLNNAQRDEGNCLILPYGDLNYNGEYLIIEYMTNERNNSNAVYTPWITAGNGIRAYHVKADIYDNGWWTFLKYENGSEFTNGDDDGIRLIRLVNDAEGGDVFTTGQTLDGSISGWHWYASDESESVETGYSVTIGELKDGQYTVTVNKN
ncbi:MAG: hypothetical protein E7496_05120 [Ruminococcus sp.]|nr:hypothetical protein [Ruminococcus sp.]